MLRRRECLPLVAADAMLPGEKRILFSRARTGELPAIWVMNADESRPRCRTLGCDDEGADFPHWLA